MTAQLADDIALHRLQVSIELRREPLDKHDQMRRLTAAVLYREGDSPEAEQIGLVTGWVSRDFDPELLAAAGDSVGPQAGVLTFFAEEVIKAEPALCWQSRPMNGQKAGATSASRSSPVAASRSFPTPTPRSEATTCPH